MAVSTSVEEQETMQVPKAKPIEHALLCALSIVNGLCYMDRYLIGALLPYIQEYFDMNDALAGLVYGSFSLIYSLFYPLCVYLGQYYRHRHFLHNSCLLWLVFSALSGMCFNVYLFVYMRILVAALQANYASISLQVMTKVAGKYPKQGSIWLRVYQIAGPVGVGCGFVIASKLLALGLKWGFCFSIVPVLLLITVPVLCLARVKEDPIRLLPSAISDHLIWNLGLMYEIYGIPTEVFNTLACICAGFYNCAIYLWLPSCLHRQSAAPALHEVLWTLGGVIALSNLAGMLVGILLSRFLYKHLNAIDCIVCGLSLFMSMPLMAAMLYYCSSNKFLTTILFALSQVIFSMHIPVSMDIMLYVVPPPKRIFASTLNALFVNLFGDATSALSVGILSTWFKKTQTENSATDQNNSSFLQAVLSFITLFQLFGAFFFFLSAFFVERDREHVRSVYPVSDRNMQPRYKRAFISIRSLTEL